MSRQAGIRDIAEAAGVGVSTVHRALHNKPNISPSTQQTILKVAEELGYRPHAAAQRLRRRENRLVGIAAQSLSIPTMSPLHAFKYHAAIQELECRGYTPQPWSSARDSEWLVRLSNWALSERIGGLLLLEGYSSLPSELKAVSDAGIPIIGLGGGGQFPGVDVDRQRAFYDLTRHLLELGHRNFAYVGRMSESSPRMAGIRHALQEETEKTRLQWSRAGTKKTTSFEMGAQSVPEFLEWQNRPTAVICSSDHVAMAFMNGLASVDIRIPEDVAVVGFDGLVEAEYYRPPLTTVTQPVEKMARRAVELLLEHMAGQCENEPPVYEEFPGRLVIRESCGYRQA